MKRFVLDSNALSLWIHRRHGVYERAQRERKAGARIGTGIPIVAEILGGVFASDTRDANLPIVEGRISKLLLWPFDMTAAREYARLYAEMKRKGDHVQAVDLMLAAIAMNLKSGVVVTSDSDFARVPGLSIENWAT